MLQLKKILIFILFLFCCEKPKEACPEANGLVLGFDARKAYCLYGWKIKIGNDTILTASDIMYEKIGFDIKEPIPVYIEIKEMDTFCRYHIHDVIRIEKVVSIR
jgi:hypothetical protein